jgi:hypothetical protein
MKLVEIRDVRGGRFLRLPGGRYRLVLAGGGGGGKTTVTSTVAIPPKSPEELDLLRKQNDLLDIQLSELKRQNDALTEAFPAQKALFEAQTSAATAFAKAQNLLIEAQAPLIPEQIAAARDQLVLQKQISEAALKALTPTPEQEEIDRLSNARTLAILRGEPPPVSEAQKANLDTLYGAARTTGEEDIRRFGEEMAASRGLRLTDAPIGAEVLRQQRDLATNLRGARASSELNLGLSQQNFDESVRQFQAGLQQAAQQNRLALLGQVKSPTGMTNYPAPGGSPVFSTQDPTATFSAINPLIGTMTGERIAGATRTERSSFSTYPGVLDYLKVLMSGAGAAAGGIAMSTARVKKDIMPLDRDEYDRARRRLIRETPVTRWRYKWEGADRAPHTGPILELAPEEIREDDAHLNLLNYTGTLHAAVKAIDRDVQDLQANLRAARQAA